MTLVEITKTRTKLGMTQKQLSKLIKKTPTFVCKLENKQRQLTSDLQTAIKKAFSGSRKSATKKVEKKQVAKKMAKRGGKK
jgi:ribosome-binding protein aMBF1 (putative translation factor)